MKAQITIPNFDKHLSSKGLSFDGIAIGGTALNLLGVVIRETVDCDILDPEIPEEIKTAAIEFAKNQRAKGNALLDKWFNNGPSSLVPSLPKGWQERLVELYSGSALTLLTLGRSDLLKTKLYAFCDRGEDLQDCLGLSPTRDELLGSLAWVQFQDGNPMWPDHVKEKLSELARELGYEL